MYSDSDRAIALAGVFTAATCVHSLACEGRCSSDTLLRLTQSIFENSPSSVKDVYRDLNALQQGALCIKGLALGSGQGISLQVANYSSNLIQLAKISLTKPDMLEAIANSLKQIDPSQASNAEVDDLTYQTPYLLSQIDRTYQETLSKLNFRIQVQGSQDHLQNQAIAAKIRVCLLAGFRAAFLWQQVGGRRWHLMFKRRKYAEAIEQVIH